MGVSVLRAPGAATGPPISPDGASAAARMESNPCPRLPCALIESAEKQAQVQTNTRETDKVVPAHSHKPPLRPNQPHHTTRTSIYSLPSRLQVALHFSVQPSLAPHLASPCIHQLVTWQDHRLCACASGG